MRNDRSDRAGTVLDFPLGLARCHVEVRQKLVADEVAVDLDLLDDALEYDKSVVPTVAERDGDRSRLALEQWLQSVPEQKVFALPSSGWYVRTSSSPASRRMSAVRARPLTVPAPPESFSQLVQWQ